MERCRTDGMPPPEPDVDRWIADGWSPLEPLHAELISYEYARAELGDVAVEGGSGPVLDWPDGWDAHALVEHRLLVAAHFRALGTIQGEEQAAMRGVLRMLCGAR